MAKKLISVRLDENILLDIEKLVNSNRFNNRTEVIETSLERSMKFLKKDVFSRV